MRPTLSAHPALLGLAGFLALAAFGAPAPARAEAPAPEPAATAPAPGPAVSSFILGNGMRAVVIEDHRAPVVTHMVWYPMGGADSPPGKSGIAHYLEHLMFKGTDEIPEGAFSKIIAANGGSDNAFTGPDYTAYFQRIAADRLDLVMRMEADRMRDLEFSEEIAITERAVVLEERSQRTDNNPQSLLNEQLGAMLYLNHPYNLPVIGWRHEIETLNRDDALAYYRRYYAPDNAILVVAGDVTPEEVERLATIHYGPLEPSGQPPAARPAEPPAMAPRRLTLADEKVRQPYVLRRYLVPSRGTGDTRTAAALEILSQVLGAGITSRFAQAMEQGDKSAIDTGAYYYSGQRDATGFTIYAVPAEGVGLAEVEAGLERVLEEVREGGPTEDELSRIKRKMHASDIYALDDQQSLARRYGAGLAAGLSLAEIAEWPAVLQSITAEEVREAAHLLQPEASATGWLVRQTAEEEQG
ncbi:pitrilysin family protein [Paralimibaculum aggregatum]|uniref:Pitrilysin family protein n=1 Tax=Paralimibaculum aggregatum TaxID=3036245 RepID=A0ABQ6LJ17_9RHOB|nr:pitrilysin family protein [Limibaculum sp. NKW23]GMG82220.1 pitrilysin family protein [Limibaculum sp. NKW23]